jgi:hypothetical protein
MPSTSSRIHPHEGRPKQRTRPISDHRFTRPVVRPLRRPVVPVLDARVW